MQFTFLHFPICILCCLLFKAYSGYGYTSRARAIILFAQSKGCGVYLMTLLERTANIISTNLKHGDTNEQLNIVQRQSPYLEALQNHFSDTRNNITLSF